MADGLVDRTSFGKLGVELGFADASEPEAIAKEVLGLILGGDDDLQAVVFHFLFGWWFVLTRKGIPPPFDSHKIYFKLFSPPPF